MPILMGVSCSSLKKEGAPRALSAEHRSAARPEDVARVDEFFANGGKNGFHPPSDKTPDLNATDTAYVVELDQQRVYLYHHGELIAASRISSGRSGYRTETGSYSIGQKNLNHRSNLYGNYVSPDGRTVSSDIRAGYDPQPEGAHFVGSLMKYFQRFELKGSPTAMGFHQGVVPNHPASHGCIRLPASMASWFFTHVEKGTPVAINGSKFGVKPGTRQAGSGRRAPKKSIPAPLPEDGASPAPPDASGATTAAEAGAGAVPATPSATEPASTDSTTPVPASASPTPEAAAPAPGEPPRAPASDPPPSPEPATGGNQGVF